MKKIVGVIIGMSVAVPLLVTAQSVSMLNQNIFTSASQGFSLEVPQGWIKYEYQYKSLKGGDLYRLVVTQVGDLVSRPTKALFVTVGTTDAVFGVSKAVVQKVSKENLVDFFIDQSFNTYIDYTVTKAYTKGEGDKKVYVVEATYLEPGPYRIQTVDYFQFLGDKVYHTTEYYFTAFSNYAPTLQGIVDSFTIRTP